MLQTFYNLQCFLELFIVNLNHELAQNYSCPVATFASCSQEEKLRLQAGANSIEQWEPATRSCPEQLKACVNSNLPGDSKSWESPEVVDIV